MEMKPFKNVAVVGMHFRERDGIPAKAYVESFVPPLELQLEREEDNKFDSFAIKVLFQGEHIGYIEAAKAMFISPWIDQGVAVTCIVDSLEQRRNNLHPICTIKAYDAATGE